MNNRMILNYNKPAIKWEETLPIGNGSLGAMIFGGVTEEILGLNEETLWSGYYQDKNNKDAFKHLGEVRELVFQQKYKEAEDLIQETMLGEYNESYLPLGNLHMRFHHEEEVNEYTRELDIDHSIARVTYMVDNVRYEREYFASYPHQSIFMRIKADKPVIDVSVSLKTELRGQIDYSKDGFILHGRCPEHVDPSYINRDEAPIIWGEKGICFNSELNILSCNGNIEVIEELDKLSKENRNKNASEKENTKDSIVKNVKAEGNAIHINNASEIILQLQVVKVENSYHGINYKNISYEEIKKIHCKDYERIYNKVELYLGDQLTIPTDLRLIKLKEGGSDPAFYALYFQYGRYLLISSSREGSLPANLQGIWSWEFRAPWSSNWTTNINAEMNYWPAQSCNLSECISPYFELIKRLCEEGKKTAEINYHCRGFVHHHNADVWCNTSPCGLARGDVKGYDGSVAWSFWPMGGAWMVSELYKHYEYNQDKQFLKEMAFPIIKEAALFLIDWLVEYEGVYVTCPSTSPENHFVTKDGKISCVAMSCTMDLTLIREVFYSFQKTCKELEIEDTILLEIEERLSKLAPIKIGSLGQLFEWNEEFEEQELGHRHISHLYGLFPSELFSESKELIEACRVSLERRLVHGGGHTGWSCAWILNMYAILGEKEKAYEYLNTLLTRSTYDNLWDAHPPFQIDGNFGGIAGIANMLVQDRNNVLKILPALPKEFKSGYVKGLRIKGNKMIDIYWEDGKETNHTITTI